MLSFCFLFAFFLVSFTFFYLYGAPYLIRIYDFLLLFDISLSFLAGTVDEWVGTSVGWGPGRRGGWGSVATGRHHFKVQHLFRSYRFAIPFSMAEESARRTHHLRQAKRPDISRKGRPHVTTNS
jgi:hypothetical protein